MVGTVHISVRNRRNSYDFTLKRNLTVLRGDSATGKTTLYEMIRDYNNNSESGVKISCNKSVETLEGRNWEQQLEGINQSVVVIDEGSSFIKSKDFAKKVRGSDNYFLLITRDYLQQLPYSVDEIYRIKGRGKNKRLEKIYADVDKFYNNPDTDRFPIHPDVIITEDSGSGFQFFSNVAENIGIICESATGNSNIIKKLKEHRNSNIIVVADGAAIGAAMESLVKEQENSMGKLALFLPESFEWLILKSGVVGRNLSVDELDSTQEYADSKFYMSWEQYFTELLERLTANRVFMKYNKGNLSSYYTQAEVRRKILGQIPHVDF